MYFKSKGDNFIVVLALSQKLKVQKDLFDFLE